jgi:hemerythrin-like domain-containing protein
METIRILNKEHQNILIVITSIEQECERLKTGTEIDPEFFEKAIDFIKNYADKFHHAKEEDILFKEFEDVSEQAHCNPVPQMLHEHELGRNFVKGMQEAIKTNDKESLIENSNGYAQLLREHIYKEDDILYPMIEDVLSDGTEEKMFEEFKKVELDKKYLAIVKEFEERK